MTTIEDAIKTIRALAAPEATIAHQEEIIRRLHVESHHLRETIHKQSLWLQGVQSVLQGADTDIDPRRLAPESLATTVKQEIYRSRSHYDQAVRQFRTAEGGHGTAREDLLQHTTSMILLYNKTAPSVLFGTGEPPEYVEILAAIEAAIKDRQNKIQPPEQLQSHHNEPSRLPQRS